MLDERATGFLRDWAFEHGVTLRLDRQLTNGLTDAQVVVVIETAAAQRSRKLILKVCPEDEDGGPREPARHMAALRNSPAGFAHRHLVGMAHDPVPTRDGRWLVFQRVAGGSLDDWRPLSALLDAAASPNHPTGPICRPADLAKTCRTVVKSILEDWNPTDDIQDVSPDKFLRWQLERRHEPGGSLYKWATVAKPALLQPTIDLAWDGESLTNPLTLLLDPAVTAGRKVCALVGRAHGDLHPENILLRVNPELRPSKFRLIDLSRYSAEAPLSRDPVHLLLAVAARGLDHLSRPQQTALRDLLIDPNSSAITVLPPWLSATVTATYAETEAWASKSGLTDDWRQQTKLSLLACALIFAGRRTTPEQYRDWFVRLAADAATDYLQPRQSAPPVPLGVRIGRLPRSSNLGMTADRPPSAPARGGGSQRRPPTTGSARRRPHLRPAVLAAILGLTTLGVVPARTLWPSHPTSAPPTSAGPCGPTPAATSTAKASIALMGISPLPATPEGVPAGTLVTIRGRVEAPTEACFRVDVETPSGLYAKVPIIDIDSGGQFQVSFEERGTSDFINVVLLPTDSSTIHREKGFISGCTTNNRGCPPPLPPPAKSDYLAILRVGLAGQSPPPTGPSTRTLTVTGGDDAYVDADHAINGRVPLEFKDTPQIDIRINLDNDEDAAGARVRVRSTLNNGTPLGGRLAKLDPDRQSECNMQAPWQSSSIEMIPSGYVCVLSSDRRLYIMRLVENHTSKSQLDATFNLMEVA